MNQGYDYFLALGMGFEGFIALIVVLVLVMVAMSLRQQGNRDRQLTAFIAQQGWNYRRSAPELATQWSGPPFAGTGGQTSKAISGTIEGQQFTAFAYTWTTGSGDSEVTHHDVVVAVGLPVALPLLWIVPQTPENRFTNPLGSHDITFESPDFNSAFMVTADNDRYAYAVLSSLMMEFLLCSPARIQPIRIERNHALTWITSDLTPEAVMGAATLLSRLVSRIPGHVYDQHASAMTTGYAGSVSGLRPEATGADVMRTGFVLLWGIFWVGTSSVMTAVAYFLVTNTPTPWYYLAMPVAFIGIGLVVVAAALVRLITGGWAIRQNKHKRTEPMASAERGADQDRAASLDR
jgi:hypothetical protein